MRDWRNVIRVVWVMIVNTSFSSLVTAILSLNLNLPLNMVDWLPWLLTMIFVTICLCGIVLQLRKRQVAVVVNISIPVMLLLYALFEAHFTPVPAKIAHA